MLGMDEFIRLVNNPLRFRFFLFIKLPAAFLAGVRLK
ncbi:MAG: thioesterase, partial [Chitinophagaceae bacterium]|nr:thioesterase [Chitinophagaceae bacterium]